MFSTHFLYHVEEKEYFCTEINNNQKVYFFNVIYILNNKTHGN